jgi:energy-coupling factor transporter ATP-binding protein EcfA2
MSAMLRVRDLVKHFPVRQGLFGRSTRTVRAVDGVSFELAPGKTFAIVGESGCGKSTVARLLLRLIEPTAGALELDGHNLIAADASASALAPNSVIAKSLLGNRGALIRERIAASSADGSAPVAAAAMPARINAAKADRTIVDPCDVGHDRRSGQRTPSPLKQHGGSSVFNRICRILKFSNQ